MGRGGGRGSLFLRSIIDLISPRACHICGKRLAVTEEEICGVCNWHLPRTHFNEKAEDNNLARQFWGKIPIEKASSLFFYQPQNDPSHLIYDLKYHNQPHLGVWLGRILAMECNEHNFFDGIDIIIPVPISFGRRWKRGYNQSEKIAQGISEVTGIAICTKALKRVHYNKSQTKLTAIERAENVDNAFQLKSASEISGKHVLIVDDIITTGATITACAKELMKAGNVRFSVLSIGFTEN